MLTVVILFALLMMGSPGRAAASDLHVFGKSESDNALQSHARRHTERKQPYQQMKNGVRRSLDLESLNIHVSPTSSKISLPSIIRIYPPTAQPLHVHANMPLRFGRESSPADDRASSTTPNMPQRFGRSWELIHMCAECRNVREASSPVLPQRFGRNVPSWSLLRALTRDQPLNTGLRWTEDFDFSSEEEVELQEKNL